MKKKTTIDLPDEIEPSIPNSDALKDYMEDYKKRDTEGASSALWLFCSCIALIFIALAAACIICGCNITLIDSQYHVIRYHDDDNLTNSSDDKALISLNPKAV